MNVIAAKAIKYYKRTNSSNGYAQSGFLQLFKVQHPKTGFVRGDKDTATQSLSRNIRRCQSIIVKYNSVKIIKTIVHEIALYTPTVLLL